MEYILNIKEYAVIIKKPKYPEKNPPVINNKNPTIIYIININPIKNGFNTESSFFFPIKTP